MSHQTNEHPKTYNRHQYVSWQPDSYARFGAHPDFDSLYDRFTKDNFQNNGGDLTRLWSLILNCSKLIEEGVGGDFAELGVWRGNTAAILAHFASRNGRKVWLFDTFEGFDAKDLEGVDASVPQIFSDTSVGVVQEVIGSASSCCEFIKGYFPGSFVEPYTEQSFALVSLDCDLYKPMAAGLELFYSRMPKGGMFFLHDYSSKCWPGTTEAVDEFCKRTGEFPILLPDKSGSAVIRKSR